MPKQSPPGPDGLPILGNTHQWARDQCAFRKQCADKYGTVVKYNIFGTDAYMFTDPEDIERILATDSNKFQKHAESAEKLRDVIGMGEGLLTTEGPQWEHQRETIEPAFYMDQIKSYADRMVNRSEKTIERWHDGEIVEIRSEMMETTLGILLDAMFGSDVNLEARNIYTAVDDLLEPFETDKQPFTFLAPDWAPLPFLRRAARARNYLEEQIFDVIETRRTSDDDRDDLISLLLEAGMGNERIKDNMMTFLLAGHETTALTLTYVWDLLSRNPHVEQKVLDEIETVCDGQSPTINDVFSFDYLENVIKESLRLYPPSPQIRREPTTDIKISDYNIPKGALIVLPLWVMHRDERFWDDPDEFQPERWENQDGLSETANTRPDYAYFPFGGGPRRCIGSTFAMTEGQLMLATMAQECRFKRQYEDMEISAGITVRPKMDVEMRVEFR